MSRTQKRIIPVTVAIASILVTGASLASSDQENKDIRLTADMLTMEQITAQALTTHPGKVTEASLEREEGKMVWEVEIEGDNGRELEIYYDAKTGKEIKSEFE